MNSDQKTALPGNLDFSYQIYIITSPLNWHNTLKNSSQWHSGRCCRCPVHMALGISLHTESFGNSHSSLSEASSDSRGCSVWVEVLGIAVNQRLMNTPASSSFLRLLIAQNSKVGLSPQCLITGLIAHLLLAAFLVLLSHFLTDIPEVPSWINSDN